MTRRPLKTVVRLTPAERMALERLAHMSGDVPRAAVLRALLRREARLRSVWPQEVDVNDPRLEVPDATR